ncbi:YqaJ viral recombinase family nuclease [Schaedlerella arabinosiphila]|jgi:putative phage-type endonuclease|uniref:YqaJ viral recombinase family nuclease n=1 Tax=Schaedlerella arabinosiphila TaxID=2044587 RepID=UPI0025582775|nr:YqaJ viral recombinase family protein [Schaedlerella arabinosiphila]
MKKLVSTLNLDKKEWLKYRKKGIGGSDAGAVCGLNPYRTAMQVYNDKISDAIEEIDNEAMRQGREFEDYVARRFTEATGKKVRRANAMFYHESYPFMLADVDRMVVGENAGLECKTASPFMAEHWKDGKIPLSYQIQCYHYMSVCDADAWYIAVLIYGREFKYCRLERDEEMLSDLVRIEQDFWENHVQKRILPEPDGSKLADSVIADYFKRSMAGSIPLKGFDEKLKRREELKGDIERMEKEKKKIEQELKIYMGEAERAENESYRVSWKSVSSSRIDEPRLKEEQPEVYAKYQKTIQSRRLMVKAA